MARVPDRGRARAVLRPGSASPSRPSAPLRRRAETLPAPHLPAFSLDKIRDVLPDAFAIAMLGGIELLLSAVVADGMTGRRHRSNCELVAQGVANIATAALRRHHGDRHHRPHRDQYPRRRRGPGRGHIARRCSS